MYHPTTRVLAVLTLLQTHGRMTGAELSRRLEVNARTLRRYITILQDLGAPIIAERGRNGAYELDAGFTLPPMMFTDDEAVAIAVGLLAARQLGLAETNRAADSARAKLEQAMPTELQRRVQSLAETVTLHLGDASTASPGEVMLTLSSAAQDRRRVHLRYQSRQEAKTERDFDPYGLAYLQNCWYTVGYCHLRGGLRSFRLDRILQVEMSETRFERPEYFDTAAYMIQAIATLPRHFTVEVLLKTDLNTARLEIFDMLGVLEPRDDGILLRGSTDDLEWMARMIARFSFDFVILAPDALRDALRQHAEQLARRASNA